MHKNRRVILRSETIRILTSLDGVVGGRVTSIPTLCYLEFRRADTETLSENAGGGPCPGDHTYRCQTG